MESENYCGEGFRSELLRKTESESQMIETKIFLRLRSKEKWKIIYVVPPL